MVAKRNEQEFLEYLKKYIPIKCRSDEGIDFNLKQIIFMVEERLEWLKKKE